MKNKVLSILLILIVLSVSLTAFAAVDIDESTNKNAISVVCGLGIMNEYEDNTFRPNEKITRAEFIEAAMALAPNISADAQTRYFTDVLPTDKYFSAIQMAYKMGLISGISQTIFAPNEIITQNQAIKVLVTLVGYSNVAEVKGGFPLGYVIVANEINLSAGKTEVELTRGLAATLIYNALDIPILEQTSFGGKNEFTDKNDTLLSRSFDITKEKGIVEATDIAQLKPTHGLAKDNVMIGGKIYLCGDTDIANYLGYHVEFYAKDDVKNAYPQIITFINFKTETAKVDASDIIKSKTTVNKITCYNDSKTITYPLSNIDIIMNGKVLSAFDDDVFVIENGSVTLLDNNRDGSFEVAYIDSYRYGVVKGVNTYYNAIYLKQPQETIYLDDYEDSDIYIEGQKSELAKLGENMVLNIMQADDYIKIYATVKRISGVLSAYEEEKFAIEGVPYKIDDFLVNKMPLLGKSYVFALDFLGNKIVYQVSGENSSNYAYLADIKAVGNGLDDGVGVKLFLTTNEFITFALKDKILLSGNIFARKDILDGNNVLFDKDKKVIQQLVTYKIDDKNEISEIATAVNSTAEMYNPDAFSLDFLSTTDLRFYGGTAGINFRLSSNTLLFYVPDKQQDNEDLFAISSITGLMADYTLKNIYFYDSSVDRAIGVIVAKQDTKTIPTTLDEVAERRETVLVSKVATQYIEEYGTVKTIMYYENGVQKKAIIKDETMKNSAQDEWKRFDTNFSVNDIKAGDLMQIDVNVKNELENFHMIFSCSALPNEYEEIVPARVAKSVVGNNIPLSYLYTSYGRVINTFNGGFQVNIKGTDGATDTKNFRSYIKGTQTYTYIYNSNTATVKTSDISQVQTGDLVYVRLYNYIPKTIVIIR